MTKLSPPEIDLIPEFDEPNPEDRAPVHLLRQQAELIERKTGSQVRASVEPARSGSTTIAYDLVLAVPGIGYRHKILRIELGIDAWPVTVFVPSAPPVVAQDKEAYVAALATVFGSESFRKVVGSMRALYMDDSVLGTTDEAILSLFERLGIRTDGSISNADMEEAIARFPRHLRDDAGASLEGLVRRGFLVQQGSGYSLTEKGSRTVTRTR